MIATALRDGLRGWARAPIKAGFGSAVTLGLLVLAYALAVQISPNLWVTLALMGVVANLVLGGWGLFCVGRVDGDKTRWSVLFAGFRRPLVTTAAGLIATALVLVPTLFAGYLTETLGGPDWLARLAIVVFACLTAPAGSFIILEAISAQSAPPAIAQSLGRARHHWPVLATLALLTFGLAAAGPLPGLLLERHALGQIGGLLPTEFAEYGLAIVRLFALLGGIASISVAGCVWAAAWRATGKTPTPAH